jgi:beta-glucanase (GH16 family)
LFDPERIYSTYEYIASPPVPKDIDPDRYDFTADYGSVSVDEEGIASLNLVKNGDEVAYGARLSMTRYVHYGKITIRMRAPTVAGVVSTFITMSDVKDEIDYEFLGAFPDEVQTVVFYRGIPEVTIHGGIHKLPDNSTMDVYHEYTIDWQPDVLRWYIDGELVRTLIKEESISPRTPPGKRWYPDTPSIVQLGIWDGGASENKWTAEWAGGRIPWGAYTQLSAQYEFIDIECYHTNETSSSTTDSSVTTTVLSSTTSTTSQSMGTPITTEDPAPLASETPDISGSQHVHPTWLFGIMLLVVLSVV